MKFLVQVVYTQNPKRTKFEAKVGTFSGKNWSKHIRAILLQVEKSGLSHFPRKATFLKATFDSVNSALNIFNFIMDMLRFV